MNQRSITLCLCVLLALPSPRLRAQAEAPPPSADQTDEAQALVDSLIDDLTGADDAARQKAHKQLVGMGDAAIPSLQKYLRGTHLPVSKQRVQAVLDELETHFKFTPTLVTLKMDNVHPREVFKEFSKIGNVQIQPQWDFWNQTWGGNNGPVKKISIDVKDQPFWPALIDFAARARIGLNSNGWGNRINLYPGGGQQYDGQRYNAGPVFYVATNIDRNVALHANGKADKSITLHCEAFVDPKITVLGYSWEVMGTEATGDQGASLLAPSQQSSSPDSNANGFSIGMQTPLRYDTGKNTKIASFKGNGRFRIATGREKLEITEPLKSKGQKFSIAGWDATVKNFSKSGAGYDVSIEAHRATSLDFNVNWWAITTLHLYDDKGNEYNNENRGSGSGPQYFQQSAYFSKPQGMSVGEPAKLVWEPVSAARVIRVPVEFKDIPLPIAE